MSCGDNSGHIGILGDGRLDPDPTIIAGRCTCGGDTWPVENDTIWQCELCGGLHETIPNRRPSRKD